MKKKVISSSKCIVYVHACLPSIWVILNICLSEKNESHTCYYQLIELHRTTGEIPQYNLQSLDPDMKFLNQLLFMSRETILT